MTNTCARCGVDIQPLGVQGRPPALWASTSTGGTGCTVDGVTARHTPAAEPSTPTVDTDELRELLDRIETVSIAFTPAGEKGDEWTPSEPHREHRYDGRCAVCRFADYPEARAQVLTAALARPVPAAPAEPGATEVDDLIQKLRAASVHPEAFESALYADAADALAALAASPAPADEGRTLRWTAEGRSHGTMRDGSPNPEWLVTFRDGGRSRGFITGMPRDAAESLVAQLAAAPPASAVPEERSGRGWPERDEAGRWFLRSPADPDSRPMQIIYRYDLRPGEDCEPVGADFVQVAARPAPVTAAPTEEEAP